MGSSWKIRKAGEETRPSLFIINRVVVRNLYPEFKNLASVIMGLTNPNSVGQFYRLEIQEELMLQS